VDRLAAEQQQRSSDIATVTWVMIERDRPR
jgi:hypothetical protein